MTRLSRREFLRVSALVSVGTLAAACTQPGGAPAGAPVGSEATPVPGAQPTAAPAQTGARYKEAPMLAEMVKAGTLPPVEERLPANPLVLETVESIGQYGGNWRRAYKGLSDRWGPTKLLEEYAIEWRMQPGGELYLVPSMCESYEVSDDGTAYTFAMRKGLKWSDGVDCTTEDVKFWYEDILLNDDLTPTKPGVLLLGGELPKLNVIDEYTFTLQFAAPAPLLPISVAKTGGHAFPGGPSFCAPAHYLKAYHAKYADPAELDAVVKEYEVDNWTLLWDQGPIAMWFLNPKRPVINAWYMKVSPLDDQQRPVMERNPYYWQVDAEGNQLPYIDTVTHSLFENSEVFNMWIINGEIDCQQRHVSVADYTLFKENEAKAGFKVKLWSGAVTNCYFPNIYTPDLELRALFNDVRFRHALAIAINRSEINAIVYNGLLEPRQASPVSGSPNYDEEYEKRWIEYDVDGANALLDEMGLTERDGDGFRKRKDGEPISFTVEYTSSGYAGVADEAGLVAKYWEAIGLKALPREVERSLYEEHESSYQHEVCVWGDDRNSVLMADPERYLGSAWAVAHKDWYDSKGSAGYPPPDGHPLYTIWDLWDKVQIEPDDDKRNAMFQQILDIHKENIWKIGTCGESPALFITSTKMGNVPEKLIIDDTLRGVGLGQPAQFFIKA